MRLFLEGHDYKYAVEQILLMMFPAERPEYPEKPERDESSAAFVKLNRGRQYCTATVRLIYGGRTETGLSRISNTRLGDRLEADRQLQKIIKLAFYKAAVELTGERPVWGALTGIRPGTIFTKLLDSGLSPERAKARFQREYFVSPERAGLCADTSAASIAARDSLGPQDAALYIGIPFCPTRCAYCSFVSNSVEKSMKLIEPFLEALYREIEETAKRVSEAGLRIVSVYMGGGTPTTLSAGQLEVLMGRIGSAFDLTAVREYTVEAGRPDTITAEKLRAIKRAGATRISINPQTMSDRVLMAIGRRHTADQTREAFELARSEGWELVNMDLIAGLPADTAESFRETLDEVLKLNPENVTVHTLALKKGTRITLEGTSLPDERAVSQMLDYSEKRLREAGYAPYYLYRQKFMSGGFENVGWSKRGCESLYNILIMEELCTIIALGGGGSTKLVDKGSGHIVRIFNPKYPYEYIETIDTVLDKKRQIPEFCGRREQ